MTLHTAQRLNMATEETQAQADPGAFDKPFNPRSEALALLEQRISELG